MRSVLKLYFCIATVILFAFSASGGQTVYDYMVDLEGGSTSGVSIVEGSQSFQSSGDYYLLNIAIDYAVFDPADWGESSSSDVIVDSSYWQNGQYWQDGDVLSGQDYLYLYRIRNLGDTDPSSGLTPTVVSALVLHQYHEIDYKIGFGSPENADNSPTDIIFGANPSENRDGQLFFDFYDDSETSLIGPEENSTLLLIASSYNQGLYPSSIFDGGLSDQQYLPVPVLDSANHTPPALVPAPGAFLLGGIGIGIAGLIKRRNMF